MKEGLEREILEFRNHLDTRFDRIEAHMDRQGGLLGAPGRQTLCAINSLPREAQARVNPDV
jgi:hypothetical protein